MFKYVLNSIKKNIAIFCFMVLGLFTIAFVIPLGISAVYTSQTLINDDITKYSRGEYDLLIRPESSISKVEKELKLVEENYLTAGKGGISLEQYEKIKSISGIEVAAPVSTIGYFASANNSVTVEFPYGSSYHIKSEVYTYDGVKDYLLESNDYYQIASNKGKGEQEGQPVNFFPPSVQGYSASRGKVEYPIILPQIWDMLVAIDPEQEKKLVGIDNYISTGKYFENEKIEDKEVYGLKAKEVPIIINESAFMPMKIKLTFENYELDRNSGDKLLEDILGSKDYDLMLTLDNNLKEKLSNKISINDRNVNTIDISSFLKPFKTTIMKLTGDGNNIIAPKSGTSYIQAQGSLYYKASNINYDGTIENLKAIPISSKKDIVIFRDLIETGKNLEETIKNNDKEIITEFNVLGTIQLPETVREKISGSPLGIYGDSYVAKIENEDSSKIEEQKLHPTTEPGSFVPSAPRGYTTLEAASYFKGQEPIDAIRVRIGGILKYDESAKKKIEKIAADINSSTGLHVDVVAGSSTRQIVVSIPGINNTKGIGKVLERWTTLGTAAVVINTWSSIGVILIVVFVVCGILFIINRISCSISARKNEFGILKAINWLDKSIASIICMENIMANIIAITLALVPIIFLQNHYNISYIFEIFILSSLLLIILNALISFVLGKNFSKNTLFIHINKGEITRKSKRINDSIFKMVCNNIWAFRKKSALLILQIALAGALSIFTWLSLTAARNFTSVTSLGKKVNLSTSSMISIIIFGAILLVVLTIIDRFSTIVMERKFEIGMLKTLGWGEKHIIKLIIGEAALLSLIGVVLSAILSLTSFRILYFEFPVSLAKLLFSFIIIIFIALLSSYYPMYIVLKISPIDAIINRKVKINLNKIVKSKIMIQISSAFLVVLFLTVSLFYYIRISRDKSDKYNLPNKIEAEIMDSISEEQMMNDINQLKNSNEIGDYIVQRVKEYGYVPNITTGISDEVIGIEDSSLMLIVDNKRIPIEKMYINSANLKNGKNILKKKAYVLGKGYSNSYKDSILILDSDISEESLNGNMEVFKEASAIIFVNNPLDYYQDFNAEVQFNGISLAKQEQFKNIEIDIPGKDFKEKAIMIATEYGDIKSNGKSSNVAGLFQVLKLLKDKEENRHIKIIFSSGGQSIFSIPLRKYMGKEKNNIDSVIFLGNIGTSENIIFGRRNDNSFGKPESIKEDLSKVSTIMKSVSYLDKKTPYFYNPDLMIFTPNELMNTAKKISSNLGIELVPAINDNFFGYACMDEEVTYSYLAGRDGDKLDKKALKKHVAFLYEMLKDL